MIMMNAEKLIDKKYIWVEYGVNYTMIAHFTLFEGEHYDVRCNMVYFPEDQKWYYGFTHSENIIFPEEKNEMMKEKVAALTEKERESRANRIHKLLTSFHFDYDYTLTEPVQKTGNKKEVMFRNASVDGKEVKMSLFLPENKMLKISFLDADESELLFKDVHFVFVWEFAKIRFHGLEAFEEFLYTKSKDRLALLF